MPSPAVKEILYVDQTSYCMLAFGAFPAWMAQRKGRSFVIWWMIGSLLMYGGYVVLVLMIRYKWIQ